MYVKKQDHAYGDKIVLLLASYDKGADPSKKHENRELRVQPAHVVLSAKSSTPLRSG